MSGVDLNQRARWWCMGILALVQLIAGLHLLLRVFGSSGAQV
jgi:hypothetical protein